MAERLLTMPDGGSPEISNLPLPDSSKKESLSEPIAPISPTERRRISQVLRRLQKAHPEFFYMPTTPAQVSSKAAHPNEIKENIGWTPPTTEELKAAGIKPMGGGALPDDEDPFADSDDEDPDIVREKNKLLRQELKLAVNLLNRMARGDQSLIDSSDPIDAEAQALGSAEKAPESKEEQFKQVNEKMSALEYTKRSYGEQQYSPAFRWLIINMPNLHEDVQRYFRARYTLFETWLKLPQVKGDAGAFTEVALGASSVEMQDTMISEPEVNWAFFELEKRSKRFDSSTHKPAAENPAFAEPLDLEKTQQEIALELASKDPEFQGKDFKSGSVDEETKTRALKKHIWAVRQADTLHRIWLRSALDNGLVFKEVDKNGNKITPEDVKRLNDLRPTEIPQHWQELKDKLDWNKSFSGSGEFALKRLLYLPLFLEQRGRGKARIRPYLFVGTKDLLSNTIDAGFLTKASNFKDGKAFEEQVINPDPKDPTKGDGQFDRCFIKKNDQGQIVEKAIIKRNGIFEIDPDYYFNLGNIQWRAKGEDSYRNEYVYYNLQLADTARKALIDSDKLARNPSFKVLAELSGTFDQLPPVSEEVDKAILKGEIKNGNNKKEIQDFLDQKRKSGVIFREDVFMMLGSGLLDYQKHDLKKDYKLKNLNWEEIDNAIRNLRAMGFLTDENELKMKRNLETIEGMDLSDLQKDILRMTVLTTRKTQPGVAILAMLGEILKQIASGK